MKPRQSRKLKQAKKWEQAEREARRALAKVARRIEMRGRRIGDLATTVLT